MNSTLRRFLLKRDIIGKTALLIIALIALVGAVPSLFARVDPQEVDLSKALRPPGWSDSAGITHPMGTDHLGRDVAARLIYATRVSLSVGLGGVGVALVLGTVVGVIAGFVGGTVDSVLMRIVDIQLSFPFILLGIVWAAFIGTGIWSLILVVGVRGWVDFARVVRSRVLSIKREEYTLSARALGASDTRIALRHVLPNAFAPLYVIASLQIGRAILLESTLSFLGLGVPASIPTWGAMLNDGRAYVGVSWWLTALPGLAITTLVLCSNIVGDTLRDLFDPRARLG